MKLARLIITTLLILLGISPNASRAEYSIRYLGPIVSKDEQLVDASRNGWLLIKDMTDPQECVVRARLGSASRVRLCDKGLVVAFRVNERGVVLGKTERYNGKTLATWGDRLGLKILEKPSQDYDLLEGTDLNNKGEVVGFSLKVADDESYSRFYRAYRWRQNGSLVPVNLPWSDSTQALALNDKGEMLTGVENQTIMKRSIPANGAFVVSTGAERGCIPAQMNLEPIASTTGARSRVRKLELSSPLTVAGESLTR